MNEQQNSSKVDVYDIVTTQIIAQLEKGVVPWQQPWNEVGIPKNLLSKRVYRGINLWLLLMLNYQRNFFLTWNQIQSIGATVNKGEKAHIVVFWKLIQKKIIQEELEKDSNLKQFAILRYFRVFNVEQCANIPKHLIPIAQSQPDFEPLGECEKILLLMKEKPIIQHRLPRAFYSIDKDFINMPEKKTFKQSEGYYSTLFHEILHWTGASTRLGRKTLADMAPFGSESYAMEELIAEMGSAYLCNHSGILPNQITNTVSYLDNWLEVFKKDKRFLIAAAGQAQKGVEFILPNSDDEHDEINTHVFGEIMMN